MRMNATPLKRSFAIPALFTIDTYGRRTLLLFTFPNVSIRRPW